MKEGVGWHAPESSKGVARGRGWTALKKSNAPKEWLISGLFVR
jgi:hypothetical protein